jgi:tight adherence protein C
MIVALLGVVAGLGTVGAVWSLRPAVPSLESIASSGSRTLRPVPSDGERDGVIDKMGHLGMRSQLGASLQAHQRWTLLKGPLAITSTTPEQLIGRSILGMGTGVVVPPLLWALAAGVGLSLSIAVPVLVAVVLVPAAASLPFAMLMAEAKRRRRHFRIVIGTYVDLVVLSLAGGVGIEGALVAAADVSADWATRRISKALALARDTGEPAWDALHELGVQLGVVELMELAASLQLAGTEGARIRQSLSARAVSLRRHEQAEAESAANATTERLFVPGALLLLGFLLFIGYPAVSRILSGF